MLRFSLIASLAFLAVACASAPHVQVFSGVYAEGPETMSFTPEGRDGARWAANGEGEALRALQAAGGRDYGDPLDTFAIRAEVEGRLSRPGAYGHMGLFERELFITRVIAAETAPAAQRCAPRSQERFRGVYEKHEGVWLFRESSQGEIWWVSGDRFAQPMLESLLERYSEAERLEAAFEGHARAPGAYGPDGAYRCALFVTRVLGAYPAAPEPNAP